ncbi:hypothetical protein M3B14_05435 [Kocuria marina]|uniref:hypothetical protein n=1 Tax=Kocuria marina TaxID=223184 RepID=UPI002989AB96|nr:hypothetical protein [Kocuria marina]MCT1723069.1 hypothetical protein [Kocuria marina]MCT1734114.1 hypothetical protein [Kocuria marina]
MATYDMTMNLTEENKQTIKDALETKGAVAPCARCSTPTMSILDSLVALTSIKPNESGDDQEYGPILPAAALICTNCGHLVLHSAGILGLTQQLGIR